MSINLTQQLIFETDDLKSFHAMLSTVVPILFKRYERKSDYVQLHLKTAPSSFDDGRSWREYWGTLRPIAKVGDKYHVLGNGRIYGGCKLSESCEVFDDPDKAAARCSELHKTEGKEPKGTKLWVTTAADYVSSTGRQGMVEFGDRETLVAAIMTMITNPDISQRFWKVMGPGYHYGFNSDDGDVSVGYRLEYRPNGGWNELDVSLVHTYYGK